MDLAPPPPTLFRMTGVPSAQVEDAWPLLAGLLGPSSGRPECSLSEDDLRAACAEGAADLVVGRDEEGRPVCAAVLQVRDYKLTGRRALVLVAGGQRFAPWPEVLGVIEQLARTAGAKTVEFEGRPGWQRIARDYDAKPSEGGIHYIKHLGGRIERRRRSTTQTKTEDTSSVKNPWSRLIPMLGQILTDAQNLYSGGSGRMCTRGRAPPGSGVPRNPVSTT